MINFKFKRVSSLEKVFPRMEPKQLKDGSVLSGLIGETIFFQLAYTVENDSIDTSENLMSIEIHSPLKKYIKMRKVGLVPSAFPAYSVYDDNYITTEPGMFPDLLLEEECRQLKAIPGQWRALWFDIEVKEEIEPGIYSVEIEIKDREQKVISREVYAIEVIGVKLPKQRLIHTEWFHADCLADYYRVPVFSPEHWQIINNFIHCAGKNGINMLLTPIFTPPLDTVEGGERTTVQLVDVKVDHNVYEFNFDKLQKWIEISKDNGIEYFEISHLFTQWGAKFTPKIMATVDGTYKRIFGWDVSATSDAYREFMSAFLPKLTEFLVKMGVDRHTFFHISDEPHSCHLESYRQAKEVVEEYLEGFKIIDALSSYDIYETGAVENPVVCNDQIEKFIDNGVKDLWTYYCCAQYINVSNRFMAMPSARNRILGIQMYKYRIKGFLHWGYNFYNTQGSVKKINPYIVTDAGEAFPSGDPFLVYPAADGTAIESIRLMVLSQALYDLRALQLLEDLTGREYVMKLVEEELQTPLTFTAYPKSEDYILDLRSKVNQEIKKAGMFFNSK